MGIDIQFCLQRLGLHHDLPSTATQLDCDANNGAGTWDNNSGQDYKFAVTNGAPPSLPPAPTNVVATAVSSSEIDLSWPATSNTVGYVVYRSDTQWGQRCPPPSVTLAWSRTRCTATPSRPRIPRGVSAQSPSVCATTLTNSLPNPPPTPTNITATALTTNQISVIWSASTGATSYIVARGGNPITNV